MCWDGAAAWLKTGYFARGVPEGFIHETERVPFYFLFLLPFRWLFGDAVLPALIAQSIVDSSTCVVIALLGAMVSRPVACLSGLLAALWPNLIIHSSLLLTDTVFVFFFRIMLL